MSKQSKFVTYQASVVLVSPSPIDPQSINPETLKRADIVAWESVESIATPIFAQTRFQNGIEIRTEGNRCVFQEPINEDLATGSKVHNLAKRYAQATRLVPYNALGINWANRIYVEDPVRWFSEMLIQNSRLQEFSPRSMQMVKVIDQSVSCALTLTIRGEQLIADFNYHCKLTDQEQNITSNLRRWPDWQSHMQSIASTLQQ